MELRKDSDLRAAVDRMADAATVLFSKDADVDEAREPVCEAINLMRDRGWPPERTLITCKRVCGAAMHRRPEEGSLANKRAELSERIVSWLIDCYFR